MNIYIYQKKDKYDYFYYNIVIFGHSSQDFDEMNKIEEHWFSLFVKTGLNQFFRNNATLNTVKGKCWPIEASSYASLVEQLWKCGISEVKPDFMWDEASGSTNLQILCT